MQKGKKKNEAPEHPVDKLCCGFLFVQIENDILP